MFGRCPACLGGIWSVRTCPDTTPPVWVVSGQCWLNDCSMSGFWVKYKTPAFELFEVSKAFSGLFFFSLGCLVGVWLVSRRAVCADNVRTVRSCPNFDRTVRTLSGLSGWHPNYPDGDWIVRVCLDAE